MENNITAKNLLLNHMCENCKHNNKNLTCKAHIIEIGEVRFLKSLPNIKTCEKWEPSENTII